MTTTERTVGLYVHLPFCAVKCPYCDFYSEKLNPARMDAYVTRAAAEITRQKAEAACRFDTVYFGGGTPSILGAVRLLPLLSAALDGTTREVTVECNTAVADDFFLRLAQAGVNRISIGLQSANDAERALLGRRGTAQTVRRAARLARAAGIHNLSFDLMLGLPGQTKEEIKKSVEFCVENGATHVSAYLLKIEEGTPFYARRAQLGLPDEETTCDLYLTTCELLEAAGYRQYEISNFALPGRESRHNLKYWHCEDYLGIGPAAHSFSDGKRFYYPPDTDAFLRGEAPLFDAPGGDFEEYAMLALRLTEGLTEKGTQTRFGHPIPASVRARAARFTGEGLLVSDVTGVRMTRRGFLLSNALLAELLMDV